MTVETKHPTTYSADAPVDPMSLDETSDLHTVLGAWHEATLRLEQTHEALQGEVRRLTDELERKNRELARKNRLADLGQMASHVAHEVRNSLVPVNLYMSLLRRKVEQDASCAEIMDKIASAFTAIDVTVNDLLHFTSDREPDAVDFSPAALLAEVRESLAPQFEAQRIRLLPDSTDDITIRADRHMLHRAVLNMTLNAIDAMPEGGELFLCGRIADGQYAFTVRDTGLGLTDDAMRRASEPFFTTKSTGTGLGLSIVWRIAEVHGGTVQLANVAEGGAEVSLRIPLPQLAAPPAAREPEEAAA